MGKLYNACISFSRSRSSSSRLRVLARFLAPGFERVKARAGGHACHRVALWVTGAVPERPEALAGGLLAFEKGFRALCEIPAGGESTSVAALGESVEEHRAILRVKAIPEENVALRVVQRSSVEKCV